MNVLLLVEIFQGIVHEPKYRLFFVIDRYIYMYI